MRTRIALLALSLLAVTACGDGDDTTTDDTTPSGDDTTDGTVDGSDTTAPPDLPLGQVLPVGTLEVTITHPDLDDVVYTIACLGDTATVTPAGIVPEQMACERLGEADVQQRLVEGPPADQVCTEIYGGPDVATITGTLDEQTVDATIDRANGCGIDDWDVLLAGILPPATGA